jgi:ABC-type multidrug transport system fused ATPase/permease subunit
LYRFIQSLVRPYRGSLAIILAAMVLQTGASVAGPWPLKVILDNVAGSHKLPHWLDHLMAPLLTGTGKMQIAAAAAMAFVLIAVVASVASYVAN